MHVCLPGYFTCPILKKRKNILRSFHIEFFVRDRFLRVDVKSAQDGLDQKIQRKDKGYTNPISLKSILIYRGFLL